EARIVGERPARPLGHAEGGEPRMPELARFGEQARVGRVGAGIAPFDIVDAEHVELLGEQPLVLDREVDAVGLGAVAERGVVEREAFAGHRLSYTTLNRKCSASRSASASTTSLMAK